MQEQIDEARFLLYRLSSGRPLDTRDIGLARMLHYSRVSFECFVAHLVELALSKAPYSASEKAIEEQIESATAGEKEIYTEDMVRSLKVIPTTTISRNRSINKFVFSVAVGNNQRARLVSIEIFSQMALDGDWRARQMLDIMSRDKIKKVYEKAIRCLEEIRDLNSLIIPNGTTNRPRL